MIVGRVLCRASCLGASCLWGGCPALGESSHRLFGAKRPCANRCCKRQNKIWEFAQSLFHNILIIFLLNQQFASKLVFYCFVSILYISSLHVSVHFDIVGARSYPF